MQLLYFASLRETLAMDHEVIAKPAGIDTVGQLREYLAGRGGVWQALTEAENLRAAVNQRLCGMDALIGDSDEVAFFPPVTGG